jgi:hypothetical protein
MIRSLRACFSMISTEQLRQVDEKTTLGFNAPKESEKG